MSTVESWESSSTTWTRTPVRPSARWTAAAASHTGASLPTTATDTTRLLTAGLRLRAAGPRLPAPNWRSARGTSHAAAFRRPGRGCPNEAHRARRAAARAAGRLRSDYNVEALGPDRDTRPASSAA